ncbi:Hypothetical predicted protein [Marmota monax]|uniref:Uncharacterized protein n=1 Tax=Marmota monax TaxID=9995 RepID=A0A5E4CHK7_MARMO|nr:hypothetical protein GHT09_012479 [Marmota monax]VTJ81333.1 Hypothetical predicted protein [Marmota monax]
MCAGVRTLVFTCRDMCKCVLVCESVGTRGLAAVSGKRCELEESQCSLSSPSSRFPRGVETLVGTMLGLWGPRGTPVGKSWGFLLGQGGFSKFRRPAGTVPARKLMSRRSSLEQAKADSTRMLIWTLLSLDPGPKLTSLCLLLPLPTVVALQQEIRVLRSVGQSSSSLLPERS